MVSVIEKAKAFFREHPVTTERKVNQYLTEHLPRLAREYKLANKKDCVNIEASIKEQESTLDDLEDWQSDVTLKMDQLRTKVSRLEVRDG